jgi:hypothetical protein
MSLLYYFPNIESNSLLSKLVNGCWTGNIVALETGFPFTPLLATNRSNDAVQGAPRSIPSLIKAVVRAHDWAQFEIGFNLTAKGIAEHWRVSGLISYRCVFTPGRHQHRNICICILPECEEIFICRLRLRAISRQPVSSAEFQSGQCTHRIACNNPAMIKNLLKLLCCFRSSPFYKKSLTPHVYRIHRSNKQSRRPRLIRNCALQFLNRLCHAAAL